MQVDTPLGKPAPSDAKVAFKDCSLSKALTLNTTLHQTIFLPGKYLLAWNSKGMTANLTNLLKTLV